MYVNILKSAYSTEVELQHVEDLDGYLAQILSSPPTYPIKEDNWLWNFSSTAPDEFPQAKYWVRKGLNRAFQETSVMVLDYDGAEPLEAARSRFKGFTYYLYTSFRHTPETPKFRVILPLKEPISKSRLEAVPNSPLMAQFFGEVDPTSLQLTRFFYLPAKCWSFPENYSYEINQAQKFEFPTAFLEHLDTVSRQVKEGRQQGALKREKENYGNPGGAWRPKTQPDDPQTQAALSKIHRRIQDTEINRRGMGREINKKIYWLFMQLVEVLGEEVEAKRILLNYATDPKTISDIGFCRAKAEKVLV